MTKKELEEENRQLKQKYMYYYNANKQKKEDNNSLRDYTVYSLFELSLDTVWKSQMCFFLPGSSVTVVDRLGNEKVFSK